MKTYDVDMMLPVNGHVYHVAKYLKTREEAEQIANVLPGRVWITENTWTICESSIVWEAK